MTNAHAALDSLTEISAPWQGDWVWGLPLIVVTVVVHVLALGFISQKALQLHRNSRKNQAPNLQFAVIIGATTLLATALHALEASIWATAYRLIGALPDNKSAMLYSLGAMTTYGHQAVFLEDHWRLLGAIEALNGWLLFGLTTAFLFWLIQEVTSNNRPHPAVADTPSLNEQ